jgi:LDH2 family malate/lactate/ureidoglycolate dehydrogenase
VLDPTAFGGADAFARESGWLADACRATPVKQGDAPVRVPGDGALARRAEQREMGVALHPSILPALKPWCDKLGVASPTAIG